MVLFKIDNIKKTSVYITPNFPTLQTRRYKFSLLALIGYLLIYSISIIVIFSVVVTFSPLHKILLLVESEKIEEQGEKIEHLEEQILFLSNELQTMSATNKRLKYAIMLAGTDSLDSTAAIYDSLRRYQRANPPIEGSILTIFKRSILNIASEENNTHYFTHPSNGAIVNKFDPGNGHIGIDYAVKDGSPIFASEDGYVIFSDYTPKDGYILILQHADKYKTFYKHCSQLLKTDRQSVRKGEIIALSGNTGYNTTGSHLHFELWLDGKPVNPEEFIIK